MKEIENICYAFIALAELTVTSRRIATKESFLKLIKNYLKIIKNLEKSDLEKNKALLEKASSILIKAIDSQNKIFKESGSKDENIMEWNQCLKQLKSKILLELKPHNVTLRLEEEKSGLFSGVGRFFSKIFSTKSGRIKKQCNILDTQAKELKKAYEENFFITAIAATGLLLPVFAPESIAFLQSDYCYSPTQGPIRESQDDFLDETNQLAKKHNEKMLLPLGLNEQERSQFLVKMDEQKKQLNKLSNYLLCDKPSGSKPKVTSEVDLNFLQRRTEYAKQARVITKALGSADYTKKSSQVLPILWRSSLPFVTASSYEIKQIGTSCETLSQAYQVIEHQALKDQITFAGKILNRIKRILSIDDRTAEKMAAKKDGYAKYYLRDMKYSLDSQKSAIVDTMQARLHIAVADENLDRDDIIVEICEQQKIGIDAKWNEQRRKGITEETFNYFCGFIQKHGDNEQKRRFDTWLTTQITPTGIKNISKNTSSKMLDMFAFGDKKECILVKNPYLIIKFKKHFDKMKQVSKPVNEVELEQYAVTFNRLIALNERISQEFSEEILAMVAQDKDQLIENVKANIQLLIKNKKILSDFNNLKQLQSLFNGLLKYAPCKSHPQIHALYREFTQDWLAYHLHEFSDIEVIVANLDKFSLDSSQSAALRYLRDLTDISQRLNPPFDIEQLAIRVGQLVVEPTLQQRFCKLFVEKYIVSQIASERDFAFDLAFKYHPELANQWCEQNIQLAATIREKYLQLFAQRDEEVFAYIQQQFHANDWVVLKAQSGNRSISQILERAKAYFQQNYTGTSCVWAQFVENLRKELQPLSAYTVLVEEIIGLYCQKRCEVLVQDYLVNPQNFLNMGELDFENFINEVNGLKKLSPNNRLNLISLYQFVEELKDINSDSYYLQQVFKVMDNIDAYVEFNLRWLNSITANPDQQKIEEQMEHRKKLQSIQCFYGCNLAFEEKAKEKIKKYLLELNSAYNQHEKPDLSAWEVVCDYRGRGFFVSNDSEILELIDKVQLHIGTVQQEVRDDLSDVNFLTKFEKCLLRLTAEKIAPEQKQVLLQDIQLLSNYLLNIEAKEKTNLLENIMELLPRYVLGNRHFSDDDMLVLNFISDCLDFNILKQLLSYIVFNIGSIYFGGKEAKRSILVDGLVLGIDKIFNSNSDNEFLSNILQSDKYCFLIPELEFKFYLDFDFNSCQLLSDRLKLNIAIQAYRSKANILAEKIFGQIASDLYEKYFYLGEIAKAQRNYPWALDCFNKAIACIDATQKGDACWRYVNIVIDLGSQGQNINDYLANAIIYLDMARNCGHTLATKQYSEKIEALMCLQHKNSSNVNTELTLLKGSKVKTFFNAGNFITKIFRTESGKSSDAKNCVTKLDS